jgi:hypothetical protein
MLKQGKANNERRNTNINQGIIAQHSVGLLKLQGFDEASCTIAFCILMGAFGEMNLTLRGISRKLRMESGTSYL